MIHPFIKILLILVSILGLPSSSTANNQSILYSPLPGLTANQLAIVVNDNDPLSQKIAQYYQKIRHIPNHNIIHVRLNPQKNTVSSKEFNRVKQQVNEQTPDFVQAYALTWLKPYRVDCMSITTAFAAGFQRDFCATGCQKTALSPYFNSQVQLPFSTLNWRPTMMLAGENFNQVKSLIDRGVSSDYSLPYGTAYLLKTSDSSRNTRSALYPVIETIFKGFLPIEVLESDALKNKHDIMFYFTGSKHVDHLATNRFLPGSVADHLTSLGGVLSGSSQMSSLEWIKAGATGSYGAVVEPCNFPQKFPNPGIMMQNYMRGNSLIEAYWKSVAWPGQGVFIGEPLAKPFAYRQSNH